jgi:hypothetical protein
MTPIAGQFGARCDDCGNDEKMRTIDLGSPLINIPPARAWAMFPSYSRS